MNKISSDVKELILSQKDAVFATISRNGAPNIVPIHSKHIILNRTRISYPSFKAQERFCIEKYGEDYSE